MSPVHSPSAPSFRIRRRRASPTTAGLFPECPDAISPMKMVSSPAPGCDQRGSNSNQATAGCPPASRTQHGTQNRESGPIRIDAAAPLERARARLVALPASQHPPASGDAKKIGGAAGVFCAAGEIDPKPVRFGPRARSNGRSILIEDASLPASIATRGTRTNTWNWTGPSSRKDYVKKDAAPLLRMIFRASTRMRRRGRRRKAGSYRDWDGDRSVSTR